MKRFFRNSFLKKSNWLIVVLCFCWPGNGIIAQPVKAKTVFGSDEVMEITLSGNIQTILNDRSSTSIKHAAALSYKPEEGSEIKIPVQLQTRGNFRRLKENCKQPPLWIRFTNDEAKSNSIFKEQKKMKLVMPCVGDEYVIREWLVYKLFNLLSPLSFRARLVKVKLDDPKTRKTPEPFYAILLEEEKQMARRNNMIAVERKIRPQEAETNPFLTMAVFEYLIGNTDWSPQFEHNVKLLVSDSAAVPVMVPYDFDHAGIVSAPYAYPAEALMLSSTRERRYRGYCMNDLKVFEPVIAQFNEIKKDIYSLYTNCPLIDAKYLKFVTKFLDEFYETINNPKEWQKDFSYPCDPNGTGNVVLKGLKEE